MMQSNGIRATAAVDLRSCSDVTDKTLQATVPFGVAYHHRRAGPPREANFSSGLSCFTQSSSAPDFFFDIRPFFDIRDFSLSRN